MCRSRLPNRLSVSSRAVQKAFECDRPSAGLLLKGGNGAERPVPAAETERPLWSGEATFFEMHVNGQDAPKAVLPKTRLSRLQPTSHHSARASLSSYGQPNGSVIQPKERLRRSVSRATYHSGQFQRATCGGVHLWSLSGALWVGPSPRPRSQLCRSLGISATARPRPRPSPTS